MVEAMRQLTAQLGSDAVLLSSRRIAGGFEVTGALEPYAPEEPLASVYPAAPGPARGFAFSSEAAPDGFDEAPAPAKGDPNAAGALNYHGVPAALHARLLAGPLEATVAASLRFGRLPELGTRPLLLAGPPGAGKTLTTLKLAARHVLGGGSAPLIINADQQRPGAGEQLAGAAELLGATLSHARTPAAALQAVALRPPGGAVLIDTPGLDPFDPEQAQSLLEFISATRPHVVLVLPSGLDPAEAGELGRAFRAMGATHLVPTRLDAGRRIGGIISAASTADLLLSEAGSSNLITDELMVLSPDWIAERLRRQTHFFPAAASSTASAAVGSDPDAGVSGRGEGVQRKTLLRHAATVQNGVAP
jgi:flagellar biosynthesis protein FlhF